MPGAKLPFHIGVITQKTLSQIFSSYFSNAFHFLPLYHQNKDFELFNVLLPVFDCFVSKDISLESGYPTLCH